MAEVNQDLTAIVKFANNPEPRCPVVLLLDTSSSMQGQPIQELNKGLKTFEKAIKTHQKAALRVEVALIAFGSPVRAIDVQGGGGTLPIDDVERVFVTADSFSAPTLEAKGNTPLGEGMRRALKLLKECKDMYRQNDVDYFRPWIFLISDGEPNDDGWEKAAAEARAEEDRKGISVFAIGVEKADMKTLARFSNRKLHKLKGLAFENLFQWLSSSMNQVANSNPGDDQIRLPPVEDWATVDTSL